MLELFDGFAEARLRTAGFRSRLVVTRHGRLRALETRGPGAGPPLVLLHGVGSRASDLAGLLQRLRGVTPHLIAPDLPGHGESAAPAEGMRPNVVQEAAFALLDAVVPVGSVLFGSSLGGLLAVKYAAARPERVRSLVLASPAGAPRTRSSLDQLLARFAVADPRVADAFVRSTFYRSPAPLLFMRPGLRARLLAPNVQGLFSSIGPDDLLDTDTAARVTTPTVLIWGDGEKLLDPADLTFFEQNLGGPVQTVRIARAGHAPYVEAPAAVAAVVKEAVERARGA